jgi:hypothetical protein
MAFFKKPLQHVYEVNLFMRLPCWYILMLLTFTLTCTMFFLRVFMESPPFGGDSPLVVVAIRGVFILP